MGRSKPCSNKLHQQAVHVFLTLTVFASIPTSVFLLANECCVLQTFVIDKNGKCVMSFNDQMGAEKHVDEALQVVKTLV